MFGSLGATEILVLAVIGLLVFGPRRLPEMGRTLGKTLYEFRKAAMELRTSIEREINLEELKQAGQSIREGVREGAGMLAPPSIPAMPTSPSGAGQPAPGANPAPAPASTNAPAAAPGPAAVPRPVTLADAVDAAPPGPPVGNRSAPPDPPAGPPAASGSGNGAAPAPPDEGGAGVTHPTDEGPGTGNVVPKG